MSFLNLKDVEVSGGGGGGPFPPGKYMLRCNEAELKTTKAGNGRYIKCQFKVDEGEHEGRVVFSNFNIENPSAEAQRIGLGQLKSFLIGSGYTNPDELASVQDLVGLKCLATVKVKTSEEYGDSNEVSSWSVKKAKEAEKAAF